MIGLSLSFCIADIIHGLVNADNVEVIVAGISAKPGPELEEVLRDCKEHYWAKDPQHADRLVRRFLREGRIEQPRLETGRWPYLKGGHWVLSRDQIVWTGPTGFEEE